MRVDVIVVGVGPAGCSAAYHAARAGLEVLLLDQHESRQDRAGGNALFSRAVAEVSLTGLADWLEGPNHYKYEGTVVHARTACLCGTNSPVNRHGVRGYVDPLVRDGDAAAGEGPRDRRELPGRRQGKVSLALPVGCRDRRRGGGVRTRRAAPRGETVQHEAPLVIVADRAGDFALDEGNRAPSHGVTRRQYFTGVDGPEKVQLHVLQSDFMNGTVAGYVY